MEWNDFKDVKPEVSGTYLASIKRPYANGDLHFNYMAYYNAESGRWHKNNSFVDDSIGEVINEPVVGWVRTTSYLG